MEEHNFLTSFLIVSMVTCAMADYDCICNYAVENAIYPNSNGNSQPIGYMYEFDCKPEFEDKGGDFFGIQYEKQVGYIAKSQQVQRQICPGEPPDGDRIPTTTTMKYVVSTEALTTSTKTTSRSTTQQTTTPPTSTSTAFVTTTQVPSTERSTTNTPTVHTSTTPSTTTRPTTVTTTTSTPSTTTKMTTRATTPTTQVPTTTPTTRPTTPTTTPTTTERPTTTPAPVTWPIGTYGLMQTRQGCPGGNTRWVTGYRKQDTEDSDSHNYFSANIQNYLGGEFASNNLATAFCIKDTATTSRYDKPWPRGTYCILKHKYCPAGFRSGFIFWDDEDSGNGNSHGGALPDGTYDGNTKIYYCCRGDGRTSSEIILPTERPFILLRYGTVCQSVHGMSVHDVYVRWDDEDTLNSSGRGGVHPYDDGGSKDHILHFCYYQSLGGPSFVG
ncbi:mucin-5AC-like [Mercenaria mercenaria]|uniref:mucin-5AC-like n=1 Tax=Mercenaria mercenaria TaxID=6596 RepID=UPI00234F21F0|nr:mucin-5AC-like [Mercenaria mercenaria]